MISAENVSHSGCFVTRVASEASRAACADIPDFSVRNGGTSRVTVECSILGR